MKSIGPHWSPYGFIQVKRDPLETIRQERPGEARRDQKRPGEAQARRGRSEEARKGQDRTRKAQGRLRTSPE